jgi:hypothetical protein
VAKRSQGQQ